MAGAEAEPAAPPLSRAQARALFDILTHHETASEIEAFKRPEAIHTYGPPFQAGAASTSPLLQTLFTRFVLPLPGVRDLEAGFWAERLEPLLAELAAAELSESFDKGDVSQRRTLATAASALLEYVARGKLGGLAPRAPRPDGAAYDLHNPHDLVAGFDDLLQGLVYGTTLDQVAAQVAASDQLQDHTPAVQAAHRFILINVASFLHYTLVVSAKGPSLIGLLDSAHRLIPYTIIRQTLRVGNAATMISGMVRIVLAKASVATVTNWLGLSQGSDEGMNLMQTIISTVLGWESRAMRKRIAALEKQDHMPSEAQLEMLRDYTKLGLEEQSERRDESRKGPKTLASAIVQTDQPLEPEAVSNGAKYLALQVAVEDRSRLTSVLCRHHPDLLTPAVRAVVTAYDPVIRRIHEAVDLAAGLSDAESFINDLIALAKPPAPKDADEGERASVPVSGFVALCEKHQGSMHRFLHQFAKNGPEITDWYKDWVRAVAEQFRAAAEDGSAADSLTRRMSKLVSYLSASGRETVLKELDAHAAYLETISSSSDARAEAVVAATEEPLSSGRAGPGVFLTKWQTLLDETELGPTEDGVKGAGAARAADDKGVEEARRAPQTAETVSHLLDAFRELVREEAEAEDRKAGA